MCYGPRCCCYGGGRGLWRYGAVRAAYAPFGGCCGYGGYGLGLYGGGCGYGYRGGFWGPY